MRLGKRCCWPSSTPTMSKRHTPPSRISASWFSMARPVGPYHCASASGSIQARSEEHTSELQSLMRISYAVFCLKKKKNNELIQVLIYKYKYNSIHNSIY